MKKKLKQKPQILLKGVESLLNDFNFGTIVPKFIKFQKSNKRWSSKDINIAHHVQMAVLYTQWIP